MMTQMKCKIPKERIRGNITWLEIEEADGGYYLYQYEDIDKPPKWDSFYVDIEELLEDCLKNWGIQESDWQ